MKNPKITILIATYNRASLLPKTLQSILAQTYSNWECLIIDDHSIDGTQKIVQDFIKKDKRFSYHLKSENYKVGLSGTRNYGLDLAESQNSEFIHFFDDDDLMHPKKLKLQLKGLLEDPESMFSICGRRNFENEDEINWEDHQQIFQSKLYSFGEAFLIGKLRLVAQVFLFRAPYLKGQRFDENLRYAEDWEFFSKLFLKENPTYVVLDQVLFFRRKHLNSMTEDWDRMGLRASNLNTAVNKVFYFLVDQNCHTPNSLTYFGRVFLLYHYSSNNLELIKQISKEDRIFSKLSKRLRMVLKIHYLMRKMVLRILIYNSK